MTKEEFKQREALYKHLMKLKVPDVLAELIAVRTAARYVCDRFSVADHVDVNLPPWRKTPEGFDFWSGVYKDAVACNR